MSHFLITGGAGFIGANVAEHYLSSGHEVTLLDNLSSRGSDDNLAWLQERHGSRMNFIDADIRHRTSRLSAAVEEADVVFHLAAQVAAASSALDPYQDFEINAASTLNVLESVRCSSSKPIVLHSSTKKVYGRMAALGVTVSGARYGYSNTPDGIAEDSALDFYSPHGCSKGCADQYVLDYARFYGLRTVVFRQSCIYGPRQFGSEDQGWISWFTIRAMQGLPVSIYGDGRQVRDVLHIDDLVQAYDAAITNIHRTSGEVYNIGGGPKQTLSPLELVEMLERELGARLAYTFAEWRTGDPRVYISNIRKAHAHLNWSPRIGVREGVNQLVTWVTENESLFYNGETPGFALSVGGSRS